MPINGTDIAELRRSLNLKQREFAERYKIPYNTLIMWECGRRSPNETSAVYLHLIRYFPDEVHNLLARLAGPRRKRRLTEEAA